MNHSDQLSQFFKCLSDPVRLRILNLLFHRDDICVCDIVSSLALPQSVVSRHLAYLRKHGLVTAERRGNWQYYSHCFNAPEAEANGLLKSNIESSLQVLFHQQADCMDDLKRIQVSNPCCAD